MVQQRLEDRHVTCHRRVLDLGCGIGTHSRMLADELRLNGRVVGIDYSRTMLQAARA